jgi:fibronectin type 3 domain-containing protein
VKTNFWVILTAGVLINSSFGQSALRTSSATPTGVILTWNRSPDVGVKGYRLHCGLTSGRNYSRFVDAGNSTTYTLSNLIPGKTYYCVVTAYNAAGKEGPQANEISFAVPPSKAAAIVSSKVTLAWDKPLGRAVKGYRLHYGTTSDRRYSRYVDVGNLTKYTLSNLTPGKTYYCVVTAYYSSGKESGPSNEISFTVSR